MIDIPKGLDVSNEYLQPDLGRIYWVNTELFGRDDKKPKRPYAVIALPSEARPNDIAVVRRSTTDRRGPFRHPAHPEFGLRSGWFCELLWANTELWTPASAKSIDLVLSDEDLAWLMREYL